MPYTTHLQLCFSSLCEHSTVVWSCRYNLPIKAEKFSIGLSACPPEGGSVEVDLSCALFSTQGSLLDVAYHACPSALGGSVRHCGSNPVGASHPDEDSELIHVFPALVPEKCCLMVFTAGGINIQSCNTLSITVYAKERKKSKVLHMISS
jgi:stress response protein SCP2